jgi:molecular chaperone GrpE
MKKQNKKSKIKNQKLKEQLARALADYDNLRKRVEKEKEGFEKAARARIIARILPIFDMLEEVQKHLKDSGLAIALEEFEKLINEEGVERIKIKRGDRFDENLHEAVEAVEIVPDKGKDKKGRISEVRQSGWRFKEGSIIRPVKVEVYK